MIDNDQRHMGMCRNTSQRTEPATDWETPTTLPGGDKYKYKYNLPQVGVIQFVYLIQTRVFAAFGHWTLVHVGLE